MARMRIVRHDGLEVGSEKPLYSHYCLVGNEQKHESPVQSRIPRHNGRFSKTALALEIELHTPDPRPYDQPPPSYDDAIKDLPPDYSTLAPLAKQKNLCGGCTPSIGTKDPTARSKSPLVNLDHPFGIREHKGAGKKKKAKQAAAQQSTPPPNDDGDKSPPPDENQGGGDGGSNAGGSGDGDGGNDGDGGGGDGGDDDGWGDAWNTASKKKDKKKKKEEEEEKKAAEEAAAAEAAANVNSNDLSWANDGSGNGDDSWADFAPAGKKKNKKKDQVRFPVDLEYHH